jgi:hypothetical protein
MATVLGGPAGARRVTETMLAELMLAGLLLTACDGPSGPAASDASEAPWGAEAVTRIEQEREAGQTGLTDFLALVARDVTVDDAWDVEAAQDRDELELRLAAGAAAASTFDPGELAGVFLDPQGAVVTFEPDPRRGFERPGLQVREYGPDGVRAVYGFRPLQDTYWDLDDWHAIAGRFLRIASAYARVWGDGDAVTARELYDEDAGLSDQVFGVQLRGREAITAHALLGTLTSHPEVRVAPLDGTPYGVAVYWRGDWAGGHAGGPRWRAAIVLEVDDGHGCPGRMIALLAGEYGRSPGESVRIEIDHERRLYEVDSVRRCVVDPPGGWWQHLAPPPDLGAVTARLVVGEDEVEVRGASPLQVELLRWSLARFEQAGLPPPRLAAVTFASGAGRCAGIAGQVAWHDGDPADVLLCVDEGAIAGVYEGEEYTIAARMAALHELGHVWDGTRLGDHARERYLQLTGLTTWMGADVSWEQRGGERAAEVIMWGLLDTDVPLARFDRPPCQRLAREFRELTGRAPLRTCPA